MKKCIFPFIVLCLIISLTTKNLHPQNNPGNFPMFEGFENNIATTFPHGWDWHLNGYNAYGINVSPMSVDNLPYNRAVLSHAWIHGAYQTSFVRTPTIHLQTLDHDSSIILSLDIMNIFPGQHPHPWKTNFTIYVQQIQSDLYNHVENRNDSYGIPVFSSNSIPEDWSNVEIDLSEYNDQEIRLTFYIIQDALGSPSIPTTNLFYIDNVSIKPVNLNPYEIVSFPYFESFEEPNFSNLGWTALDSSWETVALTLPNNYHVARSGNYTISSSEPTSNLQRSLLVSPKLIIPIVSEGDIYLNYYVRYYSEETSEANYSLLISTEPEFETFVEIHNETISSDTNIWLQRPINLLEYQGQEIYIAFEFLDSSAPGKLMIDDVFVGVMPHVFLPPINLIALEGVAEVYLSWTPPSYLSDGNLTGYQIYRDNMLLPDIISENVTNFTDSDLISDTTYSYYVVAVYEEPDGVSLPSNTVSATPKAVDEKQIVVDKHQKTELFGNYPNPFNPDTSISFYLAKNETISINVYNIKGQIITNLFNGELNAGYHQINWNGTDEQAREVSSGVYFVQMKTQDTILTRKMILMK